MRTRSNVSDVTHVPATSGFALIKQVELGIVENDRADSVRNLAKDAQLYVKELCIQDM